MNNALFQEEDQEERPDTSVEQARLARLIEAIAGLLQNKDWQTLAELHFSREEERVNRLLMSEAGKSTLVTEDIYRLQGEKKWARRYANLAEYAKLLKSQLDKLKNG